MMHRSKRSLAAVRIAAFSAALMSICGALPAAAQGAAPAPVVTSIRCWPSGSCPGGLRVPFGGYLRIQVDRRITTPIVEFTGGAKVSARSARDGALLAKVPVYATAGPVRVSGHGLQWSTATASVTPVTNHGISPPRPSGSAFDGNGMWIWTLSQTEGGDLAKIIKLAHARDVTTVFVKSSDSDHLYPRSAPQFTSGLVTTLHNAGIRVCAWPFVYGNVPTAEANMSIAAIQRGADCLAIDAEGAYAGKYASADKYMKLVRTSVGLRYPISLAGLPYVDYHPTFPFSAFFGAGGAQYNQPQVYWQEIGRSVDEVMTHTWAVNSPYGKAIVPIGQLWNVKRNSELLRFRSLSARWGASGVSWWDWQESKLSQWGAVGSALPWPAAALDAPNWITLQRNSAGDLVRWAQQHLIAAGAKIKVTGKFDAPTVAAVQTLQAQHLLLPTGSVDTATWKVLLAQKLPLPAWAKALSQPAKPTAGTGGGHQPPPVHVTSYHRRGSVPPLGSSMVDRTEFARAKLGEH